MFSKKKKKKVTLTPSNFKEFNFESLIGKHVKFENIGWTKVYSIKVLRIPGDREIVLSINEGISPKFGIAVNYLTEGNPTFYVKDKKWLPW